MKRRAASRPGRRKALETAAREIRGAQGSDRDEILAAQQALRRAEKAHDRAVARAERDLSAAQAPRPIAAYGHRLILYDDRLSTPARTHELVRSVRASVTVSAERRHRPLELEIVGPGWRESVQGGRRDEDKLNQLARAVETAAREAGPVKTARRPEIEVAEGRLAAARVDRSEIEEINPLLDRLTGLTQEGERVLDMAAGVSTGHDGILVVTDRRLLFVGVRHSFALPYGEIRSVALSGRWLGARLTISSVTGKSVVSGLAPRHAAELAELARLHIGAGTLVV